MQSVTAQRLYTDATLKRDMKSGSYYPAARFTQDRITAWRSTYRPLKQRKAPH